MKRKGNIPKEMERKEYKTNYALDLQIILRKVLMCGSRGVAHAAISLR